MAITREIDIIANTDSAEQSIKALNNQLDQTETEAKKASKSIDDVAGNGGAIAILDSLTGGLATRLKDAFEASKLFNVSLKATRGALIATGIGAFVVALGVVVAYWDDIKTFITGSNEELEIQMGILNDEAELLDRNLKILNDTDNILKLQGLSQKQINDLKREELKATIEVRTQNLLLAQERLQQLREQEKAGIAGLERIFRFAQDSATVTGLILDKVFGFFGANTEIGENVNQLTESAVESIFGTKEEIEETENRINELTDSINQARNQIAGFDIEAREAARKAEEERLKRPQVGTVGEGLSSEGFGDVGEDPEVIFEQEKADRIARIDSELTDMLIANALRELEQRDRIANLKIDLEQNTFALLNNIAKEGSDLAKAVAIADVVRQQVRSVSEIISNTGIANAKAVAASPLTAGQPFVALNTISAGLGIGASIAGAVSAIKDITSEKNTVGGGIALPSSGGQTVAPSFNLVQGTGSNQIAQGLQNGQAPIRAYVVTSDVTSGQELDRNIQGDASLG